MEAGDQGGRLRTGALVVALVACASILLANAIGERWVTDDALITFRYVDDLLAGHGLVFNPGERVEAFSSPLMVAVLIPWVGLGVSPFTASIVVGIGSALVELGLVFWLLRREGTIPVAAIVAGLLLASDRIVHVWTTGGLETSLTSALVLGGFACAVVAWREGVTERLGTVAGVVLLLLATARPEGLAYFGPYLVVAMAAARRDGSGYGSLRRTFSIVVIGVGVLLVLRWAYYDALLPHTYAAKLVGVPDEGFGRGYVLAFARREGLLGVHALVWLLALAVFLASWLVTRRADRAATHGRTTSPGPAVIVGLGAVYVGLGLGMAWVEGGDYMTDFRFLRPSMSILFVVAGTMVGHAFARPGPVLLRVAAVAAGGALLVSHVVRQGEPNPIFDDAPNPFEHKLNNTATEDEAADFREALLRFAEPGDSLLTDVSGIKGYGHTLRTVDATGLTSPVIEGNFYLRPLWATPTYRDRLPGHARWPKVEFMVDEGFTLITPKISRDGHDVAEVTERSNKRYRRYRFLHVTMGLGDGRYLRFFTTLTADELAARAQARDLDLCWRAPKQRVPACAGRLEVESHGGEGPERPEQPPGIEATERVAATTPEDAAKQYFGAMRAADCEWLRATTAGVQAQQDGYFTCEQIAEKLEHLAPVRLWEIEWVKEARVPQERVMQLRFFLEGQERVKVMRVEEIDGVWRVIRM